MKVKKNFFFSYTFSCIFSVNKQGPIYRYLNRVLDGEPSDCIAAHDPMRNRELSERVVPPKASGQRLSDHVLQFPRGFEGSGEDIPIGGNKAPCSTDAARPSQVGNR